MIIYIRHWKFALLLTLELIVFMPFVTAPYDYSNFKPIYCIQLYKRPYGSRIISNQPTAWKVTLKFLKIYKSAHYSSSGSNLFTHVTRLISQFFLATPACSSDVYSFSFSSVPLVRALFDSTIVHRVTLEMHVFMYPLLSHLKFSWKWSTYQYDSNLGPDAVIHCFG